MSDPANLDVEVAHKYFSARCFNLTWNLLDKPDRSADEDQQMIRLAQASLWHWTQRTDCTARSISIGYWQIARVYAVLNNASAAREYGELCLAATPRDDAFCMGYAYEAMARAEFIAGNTEQVNQHLVAAWKYAQSIDRDEDQALLIEDLKSLE